MSYQSFAKQEMELAQVTAPVQDLVLKVLDVIDGHGHSGASIDIYSRMLKRWLGKKGQEGMPDDLKAVLQDSDPETNVDVLMTVHKVIRFEPLSPLTGEDDEWIDQSGPTGSPMFQNRRCMTIFKEGSNAQAWHIERVLFAYPSKSFTGWHQVSRTRELSSRPVTFPYDVNLPKNQTQVRYFTNDSWVDEFPEGIDPDVWLRWMHRRNNRGIDPVTNKVRTDVMFVNYDDVEKLTVMLRNLLCYVKYTDWELLGDVKEKLRWLYEHGEHFALDWTEPQSEGDGRDRYKAVFIHPHYAAPLLRMLELIPSDVDYMVGTNDSMDAPFFIDRDHKEYQLRFAHACEPLGRYEGWEHIGRYVLVFAEYGAEIKPMFFDEGYPVYGDQEDYLYQKRRALGLAHPRNRSGSRVSIPEDCATPDVVADSPVKGHSDEPLSEQEANDIDHAVSRHVKSVFNNPKKD